MSIATSTKVARRSRLRNVRVAGGGIGDQPADVGLAVERRQEGIEDLARRSGVEPRGALERDGEELADGAGEALVQQLLGAGGLGLPGAAAADVEERRAWPAPARRPPRRSPPKRPDTAQRQRTSARAKRSIRFSGSSGTSAPHRTARAANVRSVQDSAPAARDAALAAWLVPCQYSDEPCDVPSSPSSLWSSRC